MKRRYAKPTIPYQAYLNLKKKHQEINLDYKKMTGKKNGIPFTKFILSYSEKPVYYTFEEITRLKKKGVFKI